MTSKERIMLAAAFSLGLAGSGVQAQTAAATGPAVPSIEGAAVPQEKLKKVTKEGGTLNKKAPKFQAKALVSNGDTYIRLPKELVVALRAMGPDAPETAATIHGLAGADTLQVQKIENVIKTMDNVILTVNAEGLNNEAMLTDADRAALGSFGAKKNERGGIQARGYLRLDGVPAGGTLTIVVDGKKYGVFVASAKKKPASTGKTEGKGIGETSKKFKQSLDKMVEQFNQG